MTNTSRVGTVGTWFEPSTPRRSRSAWVFLAAAIAPATTAIAQPPPGYYDSVDSTNPAALRATLHPVIDDHTRFPYTSTATDTWNILESADEDPDNPNHIIDVYKNESIPKFGGGVGPYEREHTWPSSYGFPNDNAGNYPYTDCHMLFLSDGGYNGSRSNKPFRYCNATCNENPTDLNNGRGGGSGVYPGNSNWTSGSFTQGTWETWIGRRGDVARAMFYFDVRYEGGTHSVTGAAEPNLILTDSETLIDASNTGANESVAYMGMLSVLLQWHVEDPVDDIERARDEVVFSFQGNRNPFIDHPEWAACVFSGVCGGCSVPADCDDGLFCNGTENCVGGACQPGADPCPGQGCDEVGDVCVPPAGGDPFINEFHYDNSGTDTGEFVEIAGPAGTNLSGWSVVGYNGAGGAAYQTVNLSGVIPDQGGCMGTLGFDFVGMQNGAPDGLALVDDTGAVLAFISYEGAFTATGGPAAGLTSVNIGVAEEPAPAAGQSLQLTGSGSAAADFTWQAPAAHTRGLPNTGQTFTGCGGCTSNPQCDDGLFCNGAEACVSGSCQAGTPPNCDDGIACTADACNEATDSCDHAPNNASCDDGAFCNGAETCSATLGCQSGTPPNCNDGIACTGDSCNETTDSCDHAPNNSACDDGAFCNGAETCNPASGCQTGGDPCPGEFCIEAGDTCVECLGPADCDDGLFCNGAETCDGSGTCQPGADPCPGQGCDEGGDVCVSGPEAWMSFIDTATVPGVGTVENEDIVSYNTSTGTWSLIFDGSDVGLGGFIIDGMAVLPSGDILLSFTSSGSIPGMTGGPGGSTTADDSDIVRFVPTALGSTTAGSFVFYFDASDVSLTTDDEDIDAIALAADGRLIVSVVGNFSGTGASGVDEDLFLFTATSLGATTSGSFAMHFDGSDVGLSASNEDVDAACRTSTGEFLLSTEGAFSVAGVSGNDEDVFEFAPVTLGASTSGTYSTFLDLSAIGIDVSEDVGSVELVE